MDLVADVRDKILTAIADEPPPNLADGGTIRDGFHPGAGRTAGYQPQQPPVYRRNRNTRTAETGIQSLKVRFNNVFGYYIEVSKANQALVPASYERKQTLANAERYTTPELKELEAKVLSAEDKILTLEREIFSEVRSFAAHEAQRIKRCCRHQSPSWM